MPLRVFLSGGNESLAECAQRRRRQLETKLLAASQIGTYSLLLTRAHKGAIWDASIAFKTRAPAGGLESENNLYYSWVAE